MPIKFYSHITYILFRRMFIIRRLIVENMIFQSKGFDPATRFEAILKASAYTLPKSLFFF
jgi:hypothetical protein